MKSPYKRLVDQREVAQRVRELSARTAIIDIEPLIAYWDGTQAALDEGIADILERFAENPELEVVCFATNSARLPSLFPDQPRLRAMYMVSARKPIKVAAYLDLPRPGVVIGDQVCTDGLLARRLGYTFLHYQPSPASMPLGPRLLYGCGELLRPFLFSSTGS